MPKLHRPIMSDVVLDVASVTMPLPRRRESLSSLEDHYCQDVAQCSIYWVQWLDE